MRAIVWLAGIAILGVWGCREDSTVRAPAPARVPGPDERRMSEEWHAARPQGQMRDDLPPPPFEDVPLVSQEAPETPKFVEAYNRVGRPRLVVWVSHAAGAEYDEAAARSIDYAAMENILTDWLSAGGKVIVTAPEAARQAVTEAQAQDLNAGHADHPREIGERLRADILVLVRAQPTRQGEGPQVRLVADATDLRAGDSLGRAVVDVPAPLDKPQINKYTRFVARKLMADITGAWNAYGGPPPAGGAATQPANH